MCGSYSGEREKREERREVCVCLDVCNFRAQKLGVLGEFSRRCAESMSAYHCSWQIDINAIEQHARERNEDQMNDEMPEMLPDTASQMLGVWCQKSDGCITPANLSTPISGLQEKAAQTRLYDETPVSVSHFITIVTC